jgi:hypothetical protein
VKPTDILAIKEMKINELAINSKDNIRDLYRRILI